MDKASSILAPSRDARVMSNLFAGGGPSPLARDSGTNPLAREIKSF